MPSLLTEVSKSAKVDETVRVEKEISNVVATGY